MTIKKRSRFLITYSWCRTSYALARNIKQSGWDVITADTNQRGMCQSSRLLRENSTYSDPFQNPDQFINDITNICQEKEVDILVPGHEEAEVISKEREKFPSNVIVMTPNSESFEIANDKNKSTSLAECLKIPVAPIVEYSSTTELKTGSQADQTYILRPRRGNSSKGTRFSSGGADLQSCTEEMIQELSLKSDRMPVIQKKITGQGWGVSCFFWEGEFVSFFTHVRLEEKIETGGTSTLRMSARNSELEDYAVRILKALNWHGLAMVEFKYDPDTGEAYFIEINPRLWGSIDLALQSGMNFPKLMVEAVANGPESARAMAQSLVVEENFVSKWLLGDWIRRIALARSGKIKRSLAPNHTKVHSYDDFKKDDLGAFIGEIRFYATKALQSNSINPIDKKTVN